MVKRLIALITGFLVIFMAGCAKNESESVSTNAPTDTPVITALTIPPLPAPEPTEDLTGKVISLLNGNYIDESIARKRPVAVVINNFIKALPQSGLSQADIIYEVLAEGDITRIIAIFQDFNSEKIGPVRSARHYFLDFAKDNDAIFVHHGTSPQADLDIPSLKVNNINGMLDGTAFWRDPVRVSQKGMYEHSSYTNAEEILQQAEKKGYRLEMADEYNGMLKFYGEFKIFENDSIANTVKVPFSKNLDATFTYDTNDKVYKRFQFGREHIDEETGGQLSVSNILVQFADMYVIKNDDQGRREVKLISNGKGYLITGGKYVPVTWSKKSYSSPTEWFDEQGGKLAVNKGKTWICVSDSSKGITME